MQPSFIRKLIYRSVKTENIDIIFWWIRMEWVHKDVLIPPCFLCWHWIYLQKRSWRGGKHALHLFLALNPLLFFLLNSFVSTHFLGTLPQRLWWHLLDLHLADGKARTKREVEKVPVQPRVVDRRMLKYAIHYFHMRPHHIRLILAKTSQVNILPSSGSPLWERLARTDDERRNTVSSMYFN